MMGKANTGFSQMPRKLVALLAGNKKTCNRLALRTGLICSCVAICLVVDATSAAGRKHTTKHHSPKHTPPSLPTYTDKPINDSSQQVLSIGGDSSRAVWVTTTPRNADVQEVPQSTEPAENKPKDTLQVKPIPQPRSELARETRRKAVSSLIEQVATAHGVEPALLYALVEVESGFNAHAVSVKGARGLGQVMPATAARYGRFNLFSPEENLKVSSLYLRDLIKMFRGDMRLAIAAYNAGEGAVKRFGYRIPPYPETQQYVPAVLAKYHNYRREQRAIQEARAQRAAAVAATLKLPSYMMVVGENCPFFPPFSATSRYCTGKRGRHQGAGFRFGQPDVPVGLLLASDDLFIAAIEKPDQKTKYS